MTNASWTRGEPWVTFQRCETYHSCDDYLREIGTINSVLETECRPLRIGSSMTQKVCTCSTRQLRIGKNCEQLTGYSYIGIVVSVLVLLISGFVFARSLKLKYLQQQMTLKWHKPAALAATSGVLNAVSLNVWMIGKIIRFVTFDKESHQIGVELINSFAVPSIFLCTMMETMLVCIAWIKVTQAFFRSSKKSVSQILLKLERFLYASLGIMTIVILSFMLKKEYSVSLLLCIVSQLPLIPGILYSGNELKSLLGSDQTRTMKAAARAIRSITLYTKWIAASMASNVLVMVAFAFVDRIPIYSQANDIFHPDVIIEQVLCCSLAFTTNSVLGYMLHSINRSGKKHHDAKNAGAGTVSTSGNRVVPFEVSSTESIN